jgi:ribosomal protein S18 acetylase RimI-like enzyme
MKHLRTATLNAEDEINEAIATLVLAFAADPVARWMYRVPDQYLRHVPRLFRALGAGSFEAGAAYRSADGAGVAIWFPPGVHGDNALAEAAIADSVVGDMQGEVGSVFELTEHYRPSEPHWYLSLIGVEAVHRNKGYGATLLAHALRQCDSEHRAAYLWSSNQQNISLYQRHGFEVVTTIQIGSSPPIFPMLRRSR